METQTNCCPKFDPAVWEGKEIIWDNKLFIKDRVTSFFRIPMNYGAVVKRNMDKIAKADALNSGNLMISDENSLWGADVYIAIDKEVPGVEISRLSGTFLAKVFEGSYKDIGKWIKETKEFDKSKGKETKKIYFYYTTCPKCAKAYGKNYVVILAQV